MEREGSEISRNGRGSNLGAVANKQRQVQWSDFSTILFSPSQIISAKERRINLKQRKKE